MGKKKQAATRSFSRIFGVALFLFFLSMSNAGADDAKFFPHNYVNREAEPNSAKSSSIATSKDGRALESKHSGASQAAARKIAVDKGRAPALQGAQAEKAGIPVTALSLIVNGMDGAHYEHALRELVDVAIEHDFAIGEVYSVGLPGSGIENYGAEILGKIAARQGTFNIESEVPKEYQVEKSPSWILSTPQGEVILEATGPLADHFNAKGEFLEGSLADD